MLWEFLYGAGSDSFQCRVQMTFLRHSSLFSSILINKHNFYLFSFTPILTPICVLDILTCGWKSSKVVSVFLVTKSLSDTNWMTMLKTQIKRESIYPLDSKLQFLMSHAVPTPVAMLGAFLACFLISPAAKAFIYNSSSVGLLERTPHSAFKLPHGGGCAL